jgi:hypothetical protein
LLDPGLARRRWDRHQHLGAFRLWRHGIATSRAGHDRRQGQDAVGMVDRHELRDEPAHRGAHDVRCADPECIEHAHGVVGEVVQLVGGLRVAAEGREEVRFAGRLHLGGEA